MLVVDIVVWLSPAVLVSFIVVADVPVDTDVGVCVLVVVGVCVLVVVDKTSVEAELDIVPCDVIPALLVVVVNIAVVASEVLLMADVVVSV